jgi:hypothetical protein
MNGLKDATTDPERIERWWRANPNYNVAIATGTASGIFIIDVDDAEAELRRLEAEHGALPPSVEAITARGRHVYLKMPHADVHNSAGKLALGIDVRATGGYVLAPPSMHPSGCRYCWSVDSANTIADPPAWLIQKICTSRNNGAPPTRWRELVRGVPEGARDNSVARLAGYLLHRRIDPHVTLELLEGWNQTRCTPPLPTGDVMRIVNSIAGRELKRRGADG